MNPVNGYTIRVALIVSLGGFLMGFDASVISGVVGFIEPEFGLSKIELGWAVASLTLAATIAMMVSGPLSDRYGRRSVLMVAAALFAISAVASAIAPDYRTLVVARMLGGLGVGAALIIAPMYIAELAPARIRGRIVSLNQLNIVIGISLAFFSNYLILRLGQSDAAWVEALRLADGNWRWMLGVETLPAVVYFLALFSVPESPRWLVMRDRETEALQVLTRVGDPEQAAADVAAVRSSISPENRIGKNPVMELFHPALRLVLTVGIVVAVLQQITGINAVFFYAPMIFEQSGIGTDASFMQAVLVGLVNLAFTVLAILFIDRVGRRPLLGIGLTVIIACMMLLAYGFGSATYRIDDSAAADLPQGIERESLQAVVGQTFEDDRAFRDAVIAAIGDESYQEHRSEIIGGAIDMNPMLILFGILGFVAGFAISLGPVMWVLFSELFPNRVRGLAVSLVGLINSGVSFTVQLVFPWELENLGNAVTFLVYGAFAVAGLVIVMLLFPETKGRTLEQLEMQLVKR